MLKSIIVQFLVGSARGSWLLRPVPPQQIFVATRYATEIRSGSNWREGGSMKFPFGSLMYYVSPVNGEKTLCLYIRDNHGKAVVFFEHAEWAARVGYNQLEKIMCA